MTLKLEAMDSLPTKFSKTDAQPDSRKVEKKREEF
jgi:hypothetical protein